MQTEQNEKGPQNTNLKISSPFFLVIHKELYKNLIRQEKFERFFSEITFDSDRALEKRTSFFEKNFYNPILYNCFFFEIDLKSADSSKEISFLKQNFNLKEIKVFGDLIQGGVIVIGPGSLK